MELDYYKNADEISYCARTIANTPSEEITDVVNLLKRYFNLQDDMTLDILNELTDDSGKLLNSETKITNVLVKYFGIPLIEGKPKEKNRKEKIYV